MVSSALMNNYGTRKITLCKGDGSWVWDTNGKRYLDMVSGIAVCGLGHAHPAITEALSTQAHKIIHCSNLYNIGAQEILAEKLKKISGLEKLFFSNSGAEANEAAIKLARLYGAKKQSSNPTIIVMENSFHGRTMATISATGSDSYQQGFAPLLNGFLRAPYNDVIAIKKIAEKNKDIVGILVEPIQGEGGVIVPDSSYLKNLRQICDEYDWLMIVDEIQTGNARTGSYFNYQQFGILPDIVTTAKGLANGVPIGACLAGVKAADLMNPGSHGSTFGGNPLACAAALATIETILSNKLAENAKKQGEIIKSLFSKNLEDCDNVLEVRGQGLMIGIELNAQCKNLVDLAAEQGLLINVTAGSTIRILPPLNITSEQIDILINVLSKLIIKGRYQYGV
ncbi:MAG: aspartate aminotransferase family protein [Porticoccus sp.]|jgi:acetylornithine aminotransferase|nr:aspartate aminotransferase family protein [Porticoccus sp.]